MIDSYVIWAAGVFAGMLVVQRVIVYFLVRRAVIDSYARDINEILTSDQNKVKGRFE